MPQAAEQWEVERLHRAATQIQQAWRRHVARRAEAAAGARATALPQAVAVLQGVARSAASPRRLDSMLAAVEPAEHGDPAGAPPHSSTAGRCARCALCGAGLGQVCVSGPGRPCRRMMRRVSDLQRPRPHHTMCRQALAAGG